MEEILLMMFNGINLVKELELNISSHESIESLSNPLGLISTLFGDANEQLKMLLERRNSYVLNQPEPEQVSMSGLEQMMMQIEPDLVQDYSLQTVKCTDSKSTFVMPKHRKRKKDGEEETVFVAAERRTGTMEINPPNDNYTWRKYGQKDIFGSRFPRAYYRCTHQKQYNCHAKKQVQRLDEDPYTFCITYRGSHTCHFFTTPPNSTAVAPATAANVRHGLAVVDMAESMFGEMDSVVPFGELYF